MQPQQPQQPQQPPKTHYKIFSWNVNGLRAVLKKNALQEFITAEHPDILAIQETKAKQGQAEVDFPQYLELWNSAERAGYSGTAVFTNEQPLSTFNNLTEDLQTSYQWQDDRYGSPLTEGRVQTVEFPYFYLVNVYTPNSKRDLSRLTLREQLWDPAFLRYLIALEQHKPIITCGDFNAAHTPLDLARPQQNEHNAGFTPEERQGIKNILGAGFVDTFRHFYPETQRYTWWSHWGHARENNVGWRIDYFFISPRLLPYLQNANIHENYHGSDHCPVSIELDFATPVTPSTTNTSIISQNR